MDEITQEDTSPQTDRELTSPLSSKRPRTDCTVPTDHSVKCRFGFPELLTFRKTIVSPSLTSTSQENVALVCTADCVDDEDERPPEQQETKLIVAPITKLTSHTDDAHTGSSNAAERCFLLPVKDERPPVTESDKLSSYPADDAGGALAQSHTSKDASADTSSHPDCKRLGESLEDEPPGGCNLLAGSDENGRQVQISVSQIRAFALGSADEEVRCRSDCTHEDVLHDTGFFDTWSHSAEVEESNQEQDEHGFTDNMLFSEEKEEGFSPMSSGDFADSKSFYSNPEEEPSGKLAEGAKNEGKTLELQICENENVAVCDGETKGHVNENGPSKNSLPPAAECAQGSIVSYDVVLVRNTAAESASLEADDFCGAKAERAAGKMIANARSETADHTTETPMPARISQEPAEGDNDAGPFSVIDPAIWSETDREAGGNRCNSGSSAGVELSPSVEVCEMEMPLSRCSDVGSSREVSASDVTWRFNRQSKTQQRADEKEDLCQSRTKPQACSITTNKTHEETGNDGSCHWKSSLSSGPKLPPAGDERQESHDTVTHHLKEQDPSGCVPAGLDHPKTQEVEYLQTEIAKMDGPNEIKEREDEMRSFEEEIRTGEHEESENSMNFVDNLLQQNEHKEDTTDDRTTDRRDDKCGNELTQIDEELGNNLECFTDHPYSAVVPTMEEATEEKERGDETSEMFVTIEDGQQKGSRTEASPDQFSSEWTEGHTSEVSQHEQGDKLSCSFDRQHKSETFIVENKDDLLAFAFPATSDAVVPGSHELIPSQTADSKPAALNCTDSFSPVPSAFTFCDRVPEGFDTFEKIQLSLDDEADDDAGLSNSPLLTSLPGQLLKTPERQLCQSMPEAERDEHEAAPQEEEGEGDVERFELRTENMANGFLSSDYSYNEPLNFISAADVNALRRPEQQPHGESACNSSECFQGNPQSKPSAVPSQGAGPASGVSDSPEIEVKKRFDMVLKELRLFFDISMSDFASDTGASSPERCSVVTEAPEDDTSNHCKEQLSSPEQGHNRDISSDDAEDDRSLNMRGDDPTASCTSGSGEGEQEVPLGSRPCQDTSVYTAEKHGEPQETEQKRKMWSPSLMCRPLLEQLSPGPPERPSRLEPLRTCARPIRVGLSKRAKITHLHRPHPYK